MEQERPRLAITLGDPAGVGPEIVAAAWPAPELHQFARVFAVGHPAVLRRAVALRGVAVEVVEIAAPEEADPSPRRLPCLACGSDDAAQVPPALIDPRGGQAAYDALLLAARLALADRIDGLVTSPLHKAALWEAGHRYPGHTELLAELCGAADVAMMLYLAPGPHVQSPGGLGVAHVTLHMALREVFQHITAENILSRIRLADGVMRAMLANKVAGTLRVPSASNVAGTLHAPSAPKVADTLRVPSADAAAFSHSLSTDELCSRDDPADGKRSVPATFPRIGVCALNPHAGEQGLFGDEEQRVIGPAVELARAEGYRAEGPLPSDTLLARAAAGEFDAVVAMYHDQGHIALKLLDMHRAVNITLGLPIVRTSVAHGTAFDLAWQGRAEWSGLVEATRVAARLARPVGPACRAGPS